MRISSGLLALAMLGLSGSVFAQACATKDSSEQLALVLCGKSADQAALKAAGVAACKGKTACNAWIWDDAGKLPAKAPAADKDLPKASSGAARAVWIQDSQHLMELRKVR